VATFDLNLLPIHRLNGQDYADLPGLLALTPPRKAARGREKDSLIVYLMLSGNAVFSTPEINEIKENAARTFYQSAGTLTSAMRKTAENINTALLQRNLATTGRGQYALGTVVIAVVRDAPGDQGAQCTVLLSGPTHAVWVGNGQARHIHDTALSGKGLGSSQSIQTYLAQVELHADDLLILCGKFPKDWEADLLGERPQTSLEASYRKLTFTKGDLNAVIVQPQNGHGVITVLRAEVSTPHPSMPTPVSIPQTDSAPEAFPSEAEPEPESLDFDIEEQQPAHDSPSTKYQLPTDQSPVSESPATITEEELDELADFAAHMLQPSEFAIPPQPEDLLPPVYTAPKESTVASTAPVSATSASPSTPRNFPPSIPRIKPVEQKIEQPIIEEDIDLDAEDDDAEIVDTTSNIPAAEKPAGEPKPDAHVIATRQMAKVMVGGIQTGRRVSESIRLFLQRFIPRLLPGAENPEGAEGEPQQQQMFFMPTYALVFIAVVIPVLVVTIALVVYLQFGQSVQYDEYYSQARNALAQALSETDPIRQREAWQSVLNLVSKAEEYRTTTESTDLRSQAQSNLDALMGVARLEFVPAFTNGLSGTTQISRMAASESDLYMLDAEHGTILHATFTGRSLELDNAFNCQPGTYAGYQVGALVDLLALPKINLAGATVLGIDATGNLLYCAPGQVPQAIPLPALPNTNWGRITSFVMDSGNLYVLDATSRSVWVFVGKDSTFTDTPYFYFSNQIPATMDTAIDLAVSGDDLYLLHADGHVSTCTFSRIAETPTKCIDPINFQDPYPAHQDINIFAQAHFTQMTLTLPPNSIILLLDSENQKVFRFTPRVLELQNQVTSHAGKGNPFDASPVDSMTVSPNYVLYLAIGNQVYFATNLP
jgi:hypothetical protein